MSIPKLSLPNKKDITDWIVAWSNTSPTNVLKKYNVTKCMAHESALNEYYVTHCNNFSIESTLNKAVLLNYYYSTTIYDLYPICNEIVNNQQNILRKIMGNVIDVVDDIAKLTNTRNNLSFASKFCFHHYRFLMPNSKSKTPFYIYDKYVVKMFLYCYDKAEDFKNKINSEFKISFKHKYGRGFYKYYLNDSKRRDYEVFTWFYDEFIDYYKNKMPKKYRGDIRNWDKYLWLAGKYSK